MMLGTYLILSYLGTWRPLDSLFLLVPASAPLLPTAFQTHGSHPISPSINSELLSSHDETKFLHGTVLTWPCARGAASLCLIPN